MEVRMVVDGTPPKPKLWNFWALSWMSLPLPSFIYHEMKVSMVVITAPMKPSIEAKV